MMRDSTFSDRCLATLDGILKTLTLPATSGRPIPGKPLQDQSLSDADKRESARLMRVNHAGEIAAQGLYHGQSLVARKNETAAHMQQSAHEEADHLAWCEQRIRELGGRVSLLSPFWYCGALSIGVLAGFAGDRWSLGFVKETEHQVVRHLASHKDRLAPNDRKTAIILEQIAADEMEHANNAERAGSCELPDWVKETMQLTAKIMTRTAYYL